MKKILRINEVVFTCMLSLIIYGFYGATTPAVSDLGFELKFWIYLLFPVFTTLIYLLLNKSSQGLISGLDCLTLNKKTLSMLAFALILSFFFTYLINHSISGDSLYYSNYGFIHSIKIFPIVSSVIPNVQDMEASVLARILSLFLIVSLVILTYLLSRIARVNYFFLCTVALLVLIFLRLSFAYLGGNPIIHAPLHGAYIMLFGTIFGISDLTLQSGQFLVYMLFGYFVFTKFSLGLGNDWRGLLLTFALFSIPGLFFLGSGLEPAKWTVICYTVVLLLLTDRKFNQYKSLVYLIICFSFFRLSAIFSLVPLLIHLIINGRLEGDLKSKLGNLIITFSPVLIFLPFFTFAYIEGSHATSGPSFSLGRLLEITIDGTMWSAYADVISPFWLSLYFFLVVLSIRSTFTQINIIFFVILSFIFFSINQDLWSFAGYRLEVFIPLFIAQALFFVKQWQSKLSVTTITISAILMMSLNINSLLNFPKSCLDNQGYLRNHDLRYQIDYGCNYLTRVPYNFSMVMDYVHSRDAMSKTFIPGVYYGAFIHILHRTKVADYMASQKIWDDQEKLMSESVGGSFGGDPEFIHEDLRIDYVMLGFTRDIPSIKSNLISKGWNVVYTSINKYGLPVFLLQRPIQKSSPEEEAEEGLETRA